MAQKALHAWRLETPQTCHAVNLGFGVWGLGFRVEGLGFRVRFQVLSVFSALMQHEMLGTRPCAPLAFDLHVGLCRLLSFGRLTA